MSQRQENEKRFKVLVALQKYAACVRACVLACVRSCVRACVRACVCVCVCVWMLIGAIQEKCFIWICERVCMPIWICICFVIWTRKWLEYDPQLTGKLPLLRFCSLLLTLPHPIGPDIPMRSPLSQPLTTFERYHSQMQRRNTKLTNDLAHQPTPPGFFTYAAMLNFFQTECAVPVSHDGMVPYKDVIATLIKRILNLKYEVYKVVFDVWSISPCSFGRGASQTCQNVCMRINWMDTPTFRNCGLQLVRKKSTTQWYSCFLHITVPSDYDVFLQGKEKPNCVKKKHTKQICVLTL